MTRIDMHNMLLQVCDNVYFQPPSNIRIKNYPCIIYHFSDFDTRNADNSKYLKRDMYTVTVITKDPEDRIFENILDMFQYSSFDRSYTADNLYHYTIRIYI